MPCTFARKMREAERKAAEERRERELAQMEQELSLGTAQIIKNQDGTISLVGLLPEGMHESCALAALQRRDSQEFRDACYSAGVFDVDFITIHGHSH